MAAPVSASLRCLNALRYFVRSYVTRPTTMRAITEIPANTPRPIGRTESFFPGIVKPDSVALAAAAEPDDEAAASSPAALGTDVGDEVVVDAELAGVGIGDGGTVEAPLTDTAGLTLADTVVLVVELVDDAGTVDTPLTDTAGVALPDALVLDAELVDAELVEDVEALLADLVGLTLGDPLVLAVELVADGVLLVRDVFWELLGDGVDDEAVVDEVAAVEGTKSVDDALVVCDPLDDPDTLPESPPSSDNVHCLTSCTADCPLTVMGVRVMTQVSFTTPEEVFFSDTVVNVTGC